MEADTIKQVEMKEKKRKNISVELENYYVAETWNVTLVTYSGTILKWTRGELK